MARYNKEQIKAMQEKPLDLVDGKPIGNWLKKHTPRLRKGVSAEESYGALVALNVKRNTHANHKGQAWIDPMYGGITSQHMDNKVNRRRAKTRVAKKTKQVQRGRRH